MHLKLQQGVWLAVHACVACVAAAWIYERLEPQMPTFSPDEYSLRHILTTAWFVTLIACPLFTLVVWLRIADANERYATYITTLGVTYEVSLSPDIDSELVNFEHVMRPPLPWIAVLGIVPSCTKFIMAVTFWVLSIKKLSRLVMSPALEILVGFALTLLFLAMVMTIMVLYRALYLWSYKDYRDKVHSAHCRVVATQRQKPTR
jgi:hypothetical protein